MPSSACPAPEALYALATEDDAAPEVLSHVKGCQECTRQVAELRSEVTTMRHLLAPGALPVEATSEERTRPAAIGKYAIVGVITEDARTITYRGIHSVLHVEVAIHQAKTPLIPQPDPQPLQVAGRTLLALSHPHLARVRDFGFYQDCPYVVQEYVPGWRLDRLEKGAVLPLATVLRGGEQILSALAAVHGAGLFHGAMSKSSISVGDDGNWRIIDLGLAWLFPISMAVPQGDNASLAAANLRSATEILAEFLRDHIVPQERSGTYSACLELCTRFQTERLPANSATEFVREWKRAAGLSASKFSAWWLIAIAIGCLAIVGAAALLCGGMSF